MTNVPSFAKRETLLMRRIKQFHDQLVVRLGRDGVNTMRAAAWQIDEYMEINGKYHDAAFMRTIQKSLEKIIQKRSKTKWTVEKAKTDLRGRVTGVNQFASKTEKPKKRVPVPKRISQAITDKILEVPRREFDEPQS